MACQHIKIRLTDTKMDTGRKVFSEIKSLHRLHNENVKKLAKEDCSRFAKLNVQHRIQIS
jgi:hypothetical protein